MHAGFLHLNLQPRPLHSGSYGFRAYSLSGIPHRRYFRHSFHPRPDGLRYAPSGQRVRRVREFPRRQASSEALSSVHRSFPCPFYMPRRYRELRVHARSCPPRAEAAAYSISDGFYIAQKDLELRGPGEFLGTRQSGLPDFKLADLTTDTELLELARKRAFEFCENNDINDFPYLKAQVESFNLFRG